MSTHLEPEKTPDGLVGSGDWSGSITLPAGSVITIKQPLRFNFVPKPDITAYELAITMPFFFGQPMHQAAFDALGDAQRHWQRF